MDKISHAEHRIENIESWNLKYEALEDERTLLAIYKATQEIIESIMDLLAMYLRDTNKAPKDDYSNIKEAMKGKFITEEEQNHLNEANGLRNRLIHDYNGLNDEKALESISRLLPELQLILKKVKEWSKRFFES